MCSQRMPDGARRDGPACLRRLTYSGERDLASDPRSWQGRLQTEASDILALVALGLICGLIITWSAIIAGLVS